MPKNKETALDVRYANSNIEVQTELPANTAASQGPNPYGADESKNAVKLDIDYSVVDTDTEKKYGRGIVHVKNRFRMPEKQLFQFAEYHAQEAERTGYSNYSYWKSVWANFLKKKPAAVAAAVLPLKKLWKPA